MFINRRDARLNGEMYYFTGKLCRRGHIDKRLVSTAHCRSCARENVQSYIQTEEGKVARRMSENKYKRSARGKSTLYAWFKTEKGRTYTRARHQRFYDTHPGYNAQHCMERYARMVEWADKEIITRIYRKAKHITAVTGIEHQVDHIIPLRGKFVSGLHVPENLQIIPTVDNQRKSNRY